MNPPVSRRPPAALPRDARRALFVYNLFFPLVFLALLPGFARRMFRRGGFRENFGQRLGRYSDATRQRFQGGRWWWLHSISVGETGVALKLAHELHRRDPALSIVITVTTSTGFAVAAAARSEWLEVLYNPIDSPGIVAAALDLIRPEQLVLIEGEAWPNLLAACHERGLPTALANARLSPRSARRFLTTRAWVGPIFRLLDVIAVPDPSDLPRWQALGFPPDRLHVTGSIKFDLASDAPLRRTAEFRALLRALSVPDDAPILVAGSTWGPEEFVLGKLLATLRPEFPGLFLILVPRHIERTPEIIRELTAAGLRVAQRTQLPTAAAPPPDLLLIDATGELREWYELATIVFIGKSLPGIRETGGQNPAEPAALGKAVVVGPHMENFAALVEHLLRHRGLLQVSTPELEPTLRHLLQHPAERSHLGTQARAALDTHLHATGRTVELLHPATTEAPTERPPARKPHARRPVRN